ncbi:SpoIID/LytB domain-containing protein [Nocardioides sp.]|uniref:SpoIID/LytB domain-containing protein n=1 Tax=Nocardioides sp. TaxID=35761 RepID=UPI00261B410D|nr:SpoIID/LytB domain-containing protein [Nocardioides sp.]
MRRLLGVLITLVLLTVGVLTPGPASADERARRTASVSVTGNGFGHGHGLSQWGAFYAAKEGQGYRKILTFYYPGLKRDTLGGKVSVLVSADTTSDVVVRDRSGLSVKSLGNGRTYRLAKGKATWWRITAAKGGAKSKVAFTTKGRKKWRTLRTVPGEAQFSAGRKPITLRTPTGDRAYRGILRSAKPAVSTSERDTVNVVRLEDYLKGVVPREVPALWPQQAVRAQAVAARTYAAFERRQPLASHYEICDTTQCQVYGGYTDEHPSSNKAIKKTKKQILTTQGQPAFTQFSASNGGYTSAGAVDYLPAKKDPYDKAYRGWTATVTQAQVAAALPQIGTLSDVEVLERDGNGAFGGRVVRIRVSGSDGSSVVTGDQFRSFFGLRSTLFTVD